MDPNTANWFEVDSFWTAMFPFMFPEPTFVAAGENVAKIVALTGNASGDVLDLACGPGRYAVPLAQGGFRVTAVDRTRFLLNKGRERARGTGANVEWVEQDMREFERPAAFDLALNMYTSFGYFADDRENLRVLENVCTSLRPGGAFFMELLGKELLASKYVPTRSEVLPSGEMLIQRVSIVDDWSRVDADWLLLEGEKVSKFNLCHWVYSGRELRDLLLRAGFSAVALYGTLDGKPYGPRAERLIAIARKPPS